MKEEKKSRQGRNPKKDPAVFRYTVRFTAEEHARFLTMYEQAGVYAKAVFIKARVFDQVFKVMKEMGEENINDDVVLKLKKILAKETNQELIRQDFLIAPQWIRKKINVI